MAILQDKGNPSAHRYDNFHKRYVVLIAINFILLLLILSSRYVYFTELDIYISTIRGRKGRKHLYHMIKGEK